MTKISIYILAIIGLISCTTNAKRGATETNKHFTQSEEKIKTNINKYDLNGVWGMTHYFDTIIANKELAKYRIQSPTWFAILLDFQGDSMATYGSIHDAQYQINQNSDTIITIRAKIGGDYWGLIKNDTLLELVQQPNQESLDTVKYTYRKRKDLAHLTRKMDGFHKIGNNVTAYFNKQLFEGRYINLDSKKEVVFGPKNQLTGINGYDLYEVRNYFGTLHMHKNLDVITFQNKSDKEFKQYNWMFKNDELILTEFVREKITRNGKVYEGEFLVLGSEVMRLKRQ